MKMQVQVYQKKEESVADTAQKFETVKLQGHKAQVYSCQFSPCGNFLASGGFDRQILIWRLFPEPDHEEDSDEDLKFRPHTIGVPLQDHKNAVLELKWPSEGSLYSCGAQNGKNERGELFQWDMVNFKRTRQYWGHKSIINSIDVDRAETIVCSASDDNTCKLWDPRAKNAVKSFDFSVAQTAVCISQDASTLFAGGIDNQIKIIDLRKNCLSNTLEGHSDTITALRLSHSGDRLLSNSMDGCMKVWNLHKNAVKRNFDCQPPRNRNVEKNMVRGSWSKDDKLVAGGSGAADQTVFVFNVETGKMEQSLPGHLATVNQVEFAPQRNIIASASSDKTIILGEI